ncbi:hypothetical protein F2Q68_00010027 [Brassica cretica]|uniref:Uncharacterized protein n=1 Tax=Brassica cretica TaxID=69181 RepID=A0A8S9KVD3_BRACR|nr:hypothetical protein F2Q68_00010027 [Brassica cretica]
MAQLSDVDGALLSRNDFISLNRCIVTVGITGYGIHFVLAFLRLGSWLVTGSWLLSVDSELATSSWFDNYLKPPIGLNGPPIEQEKISNWNLLRSSVEQAEIGIAVSNRLRSDCRFTIGMKVHNQRIKVLAV